MECATAILSAEVVEPNRPNSDCISTRNIGEKVVSNHEYSVGRKAEKFQNGPEVCFGWLAKPDDFEAENAIEQFIESDSIESVSDFSGTRISCVRGKTDEGISPDAGYRFTHTFRRFYFGPAFHRTIVLRNHSHDRVAPIEQHTLLEPRDTRTGQ